MYIIGENSYSLFYLKENILGMFISLGIYIVQLII
jgi:hypothetical protein